MDGRPHRVLVVEDDAELRRTLERCLLREGCEVNEARDGQEAVERLDGGATFDLILTDLEMPRADGRAVLAAGLRRQIPVVILTGHSSVETAVQLMKAGAANFLTKPFSPAQLRSLIDDGFGPRKSAPPNTTPPLGVGSLSASFGGGATGPVIIGEDPPFRRVLDTLESVADTDATVLIEGESGTGKELAARLIHAASKRARGPFVAVNCGAIPEPLLESELFGHSRGAFTGATQSRAGRFQLADGGTIFLDEIGDMPLAFQVKILRVLQEKRFEALGEGVSREVDVRVVAATHRDLAQMVHEGKFREDLYYRLNVVDVRLPALRERRSDIPRLVEQFLAAANERYGRNVTGVSADVFALFDRYAWPGNIRELANVIERMVVLKKSGGELTLADVPPVLHPSTSLGTVGHGEQGRAALPLAKLPEDGLDLRQALADFEESLIEQALARTGGNRNAAAVLLGLNRTTLVEKLRRKR